MKYEYMKESEQMLQYFQFPKFLLKLHALSKFPYFVVCDTYSETLACLLKCNCLQLYFHAGMET